MPPHPPATAAAAGHGTDVSDSNRGRPSSAPMAHRQHPPRFELDDPPAVLARRLLLQQQQQQQQGSRDNDGKEITVPMSSPHPPPPPTHPPAATAAGQSQPSSPSLPYEASEAAPAHSHVLSLPPTPASSSALSSSTPATSISSPTPMPAAPAAAAAASSSPPAQGASSSSSSNHPNPQAALIIRSLLEGDEEEEDEEEEEEGQEEAGNRRRRHRRHRGHQQPTTSSSSTPHESSIRTASPLPLLVLGRRAEQPPSARTGLFHRQQEVKMQRIRSLLLASLSINLVCGFLLATMTGYVTVVLAWGFFTRDVKDVPAALISTKDNESSTIYLGWIALFAVGVFLINIACAGIHAARRVSIALLLRYFWGAALGIAPLVLVTACAYDFYDISKSFLHHHWDGKALDGLRLAFCSTGAEAGGKCAAPVLVPGGPGFPDVTSWCQHYHNGATDCETIKAAAIAQADAWIRWSLLGAGTLGVFNLFSLLVSMYLCVRLISPSVIMTYANDNVAYLLILPAGCCAGIALYLFSHLGFSPDHTWFAATFMAAAALTVLNSLLTFLGGRLKRKPLMQVSLVSNTLVILLLTGLCSAGYMIAGALAHQGSFYTLRRAQDIACSIRLRGCCCCNQVDPIPANRCPEWAMDEVINMIAADFRIASLAALVSIFYEFGGVTTSYLVYAHLKQYQCEYI